MKRLIPKLRRLLSIPRSVDDVRSSGQPFVHSPQFLALQIDMSVAPHDRAGA